MGRKTTPGAVDLIQGCRMDSVILSSETGIKLFKETLISILADKRQLGLAMSWRDYNGNSIQHIAVYRKLLPAVDVLNSFGFRMDVPNRKGQTVAQLAKQRGVTIKS